MDNRERQYSADNSARNIKMELSLTETDIEKTKTILDSECEGLNDHCIQISLTALDTNRAREKFLIINDVSRQLPFNKKPEDINVERLSRKLGTFMEAKFSPTQEAIILIYNRPAKYFPERDRNLQNAVRPHWYTMCITFHSSSGFKIKVIDSWYERNLAQKKNIVEEASLYLSCLIKNFLLLKGEPVQDIQLREGDINLIGSKKQEDNHSCGDFSIEAVRSIIENQTWVKAGKNIDQKKLNQLDVTSTRWRIRNIIDHFQMGPKAQKEIAAQYDLEKILKNTDSTVIKDCANTSIIIDTTDGIPLFKKKNIRDPGYQLDTTSYKEEQLRVSERCEKYPFSYISQIKKKKKRRDFVM